MYVFSLKFIILQRIPIYRDILYSIHVFFHLFVDAAKKAKGRKAGIINDDSDNDKGDDDDDDEEEDRVSEDEQEEEEDTEKMEKSLAENKYNFQGHVEVFLSLFIPNRP